MFSFNETVFSKLIRIAAGCCFLVMLGQSDLFSAPPTLSGTVTTELLRVREKPDTQSAVIATLPKGTAVSVHNHLKGWYEIMIGDQRGFISDRFAEVTDPQAPRMKRRPPGAGPRRITSGFSSRSAKSAAISPSAGRNWNPSRRKRARSSPFWTRSIRP